MKIERIKEHGRVIFIAKDGERVIDFFSAPEDDSELKELCEQRARQFMIYGTPIYS